MTVSCIVVREGGEGGGRCRTLIKSANDDGDDDAYDGDLTIMIISFDKMMLILLITTPGTTIKARWRRRRTAMLQQLQHR